WADERPAGIRSAATEATARTAAARRGSPQEARRSTQTAPGAGPDSRRDAPWVRLVFPSRCKWPWGVVNACRFVTRKRGTSHHEASRHDRCSGEDSGSVCHRGDGRGDLLAARPGTAASSAEGTAAKGHDAQGSAEPAEGRSPGATAAGRAAAEPHLLALDQGVSQGPGGQC